MSGLTQRWREGRGVYRVVGEPLDTSRFTVDKISIIAAKAFVLHHHYSRSFPQARFGFGLFEHDRDSGVTELVGVLTLGNGTRAATLTNAFPALIPYRESLELSRLVLLDRIPANAESWFTARALRRAAEHGIRGVTTFSDPSQFWQPHPDGTRVLVKRGHIGVVYQALNMTYLGRSRPAHKLYFPDGTELSRRALTKILGRETGADGVVARLIARGAPPPHPDPANVNWREWLDHALTACAVQRRHHPGNHRYALRVGRSRAERTRTLIATSAGPYPTHHTP